MSATLAADDLPVPIRCYFALQSYAEDLRREERSESEIKRLLSAQAGQIFAGELKATLQAEIAEVAIDSDAFFQLLSSFSATDVLLTNQTLINRSLMEVGLEVRDRIVLSEARNVSDIVRALHEQAVDMDVAKARAMLEANTLPELVELRVNRTKSITMLVAETVDGWRIVNVRERVLRSTFELESPSESQLD